MIQPVQDWFLLIQWNLLTDLEGRAAKLDLENQHASSNNPILTQWKGQEDQALKQLLWLHFRQRPSDKTMQWSQTNQCIWYITTQGSSDVRA